MLRPFSPDIVKGDFGGVEISYEGVEVVDADKNKVKINPKVKTETKDGKLFVTLLDTDVPSRAKIHYLAMRVVEKQVCPVNIVFK